MPPHWPAMAASSASGVICGSPSSRATYAAGSIPPIVTVVRVIVTPPPEMLT
jgi:hypothetical protein